jgi:hypothetical protein
MEPLVQRLAADLGAGSDLANPASLRENLLDQGVPSRRGQLRVRMKAHSGISSENGGWRCNPIVPQRLPESITS